MRSYLKAEWNDKRRQSFDFTGWKDIAPKDIPNQHNQVDCGVFTCLFMEYRSRDKAFDFDQSDIEFFRKQIAFEIIEGKLKS